MGECPCTLPKEDVSCIFSGLHGYGPVVMNMLCNNRQIMEASPQPTPSSPRFDLSHRVVTPRNEIPNLQGHGVLYMTFVHDLPWAI